MNEWIVIVDMDQPGRRVPLTLKDEEGEIATFASVEEIRKLTHPLGVFEWWAFNYVTGESEKV